jgi:intein/homing endonuclease
MIKNKEGRAKSTRTAEENLKFLDDAIDALTPDEKEVLDIMLAEMQQSQGGMSPLLDAFGDVEYKHRPVDIETFVKDDYFLGKTCDNLRPKLLDDLKELFESGYYNEIIYTGSIGWGKCLEALTEVYNVRSGRRSLVSEQSDLSVTSMTEGGRELEVRNATCFPSGEKPCVSLTLADGKQVTLSFDHPVYTSRGWVEASKIAATDLVATPRFMPPPEKALEVSDDLVKLVAYLMSDGGCTGPTTFTNETPEILEEFEILVNRLADISQYDKFHRHVVPGVSVVKNANSGNAATLRARGIRHLVKKYGCDSKATDKRVPAEFYGLSDTHVALFLNRFWACDGSVYAKSPKKIEVGLASEGLIDDLVFLLLRLGIRGRKSYKRKSYVYKGEKKWKDSWHIAITGRDQVLMFLDRVGDVFSKEDTCASLRKSYEGAKANTNTDVVPVGIEELKKIRRELGTRGVRLTSKYPCPKGQRLSRCKFERLVREYDYRGKYAWLATSDLAWERVKSLEDVGVKEVWDLTVPGTHNLVANNIVVHNTFTASIAVCRILYELSCMKDPHRSYGIAADSNISIVGLSVSEELATKVVFENIATKIDASPYFKEHFPYDRTKKEMRFPGHIWVAARATTTNAALGLNVVAALIDEGNFMAKSSDPRLEAVDKAEILYNSLKRRLKSRFQELGRLPGAIFIISSKMTSEDFTAKRIEASEKDQDPHVFVRDYALWEVMPDDTYTGENFFVLVGNEQTPSKILDDGEVVKLKADKPEGCVLLEVPVEFRVDFEADLEGCIRDIAGVATVSVSPYIQRREKIDEAVDESRTHPFSEPVLDSSRGGKFMWDQMVRPRLERGSMGMVEQERPILNPDAPRHIHIDAALRNDSLGFSMCHIGGWKDVIRRNEDGDTFVERAPMYVVDVVLQVVPPPGDEIILADVRQLIYNFTDKGYVITKVTMDQYQSADMLQTLAKKGYNVEVLSVDRTTDPYDNIKMAMYEGRMSYYRYPALLKELRELELRFLGNSSSEKTCGFILLHQKVK